MFSSARSAQPVGLLFREWRHRRRVSQLQLAVRADISARHLSFIETGRSQPSRDMVLHLAEHLDIPLRQRNELLLAAGYAPVFPERALGDPALAGARQAIGRLLAAHEPYPSLALDRHWNVLAANRAVAPLLTCVSPALRRPPVNVLRNSLHPEGLAPRIANLPEWRSHLIARLRHQIDVTADPVLVELLEELRGYTPGREAGVVPIRDSAVVVPLRLALPHGTLNLLSTTMVFGTPLDVTLSELALELFFPADSESSTLLHRLAEQRASSTEQETRA